MVGKGSPTNKTVDVDRILEALCHPLRRDTIQYFEHRLGESPTSMSELVNYLGDEHTKYEKKEVEWLLHHSHLPELAATGWIDYEPQENLIHYYGYEKAESALKDVQEIFE